MTKPALPNLILRSLLALGGEATTRQLWHAVDERQGQPRGTTIIAELFAALWGLESAGFVTARREESRAPERRERRSGEGTRIWTLTDGGRREIEAVPLGQVGGVPRIEGVGG